MFAWEDELYEEMQRELVQLIIQLDVFDRWVWKPENDGSYSAYLACKEICELREGNQADP